MIMVISNIDYDKLVVDKENEIVKYNDELHKYWIKGTKESCISVTTLIHKFTTFDEAFWCHYKALERLIGEDTFDGPLIGKSVKRGPASEAKQDLLATKKYNHKWSSFYGYTEEEVEEQAGLIRKEWDEKREISCIRGTAIHRQHELEHIAGETKELSHLGLGGKFQSILTNKLEPGRGVYPELLLSRISPDGKLRVAGQADLVIIDGLDVYILDYKSGKTMDMKSYYDRKTRKSTNMFYPLNNIQDTNFWHYSLQLSTYAWMIEQLDPNFIIKGLILIHEDHEGGTTTYECDYLKTDVVRMLAYYKKQIEHDEFKHAREKVIF
ncbi:MAG: PD-(D/E)XK nuclease family protein [Candidatus Saccharimonadaceae bacterium]